MAAATGSTSPVPPRAIEAIDRNDLPPSLPRRLDPWRETNKFMTTASTIVGIRVRELVSTSTDEFTSVHVLLQLQSAQARHTTPHKRLLVAPLGGVQNKQTQLDPALSHAHSWLLCATELIIVSSGSERIYLGLLVRHASNHLPISMPACLNMKHNQFVPIHPLLRDWADEGPDFTSHRYSGTITDRSWL